MSKKNLLYAFIYGIASSILGYLMLSQILGTWPIMALSLITFTSILVLATKQYRKENNGYSSFGSLIKIYIPIIIIGIMISTVSTYIHLSIMGEEKIDLLVEKQVESQIEIYESFGMDENELLDLQEKLEEVSYKQYEPNNLLFTSFITFIMLIIFAIIPAAVMKKEPPFDTETIDSL